MKGTIYKLVAIGYDSPEEKLEALQEFSKITTIDKTRVWNIKKWIGTVGVYFKTGNRFKFKK